MVAGPTLASEPLHADEPLSSNDTRHTDAQSVRANEWAGTSSDIHIAGHGSVDATCPGVTREAAKRDASGDSI